jgi:hypothetical protein
MQGKTYLDVANGAQYRGGGKNWWVTDQSGAWTPWYLGLTSGRRLVPGEQRLLPSGVTSAIYTPQLRDANSAIIGAFDTPAPPFPWVSEFLQPKLPKDPHVLNEMHLVLTFTTDVAARSLDPKYDSFYWPEASVTWVFEATVPLNTKGINLQNPVLPWRGRAQAKVTAQSVNWIPFIGSLIDLNNVNYKGGLVPVTPSGVPVPEKLGSPTEWANVQLWKLAFK